MLSDVADLPVASNLLGRVGAVTDRERAAMVCEVTAEEEANDRPWAEMIASVHARTPHAKDSDFGFASAVATEISRALRAAGVRPTPAQVWSAAAVAIRAGFNPGDKIGAIWKTGGEA